jgi:outer membrane lipoprotein-sorting protein
MTFRRHTLAYLLLTALSAVALAAQTADEVIEKNIQAKGGRERIKAVKSLRFTATMSMGQGATAPVVMELVPPGHKVRMEFTIQGQTGIQAYDGTNGWQLMTFLGKNDPEPMSDDDLKEIKENADLLEGPLFDYKAKGNQVEYLGKGDLEGTPVHRLKLTQKNGDVTTIYLDADSYLELKDETTRSIRGQATDVESTYGNYKKVDGITVAYSIESRIKGAPGPQTITVDKVEVNPDIPASRFDKPKVEKKPAAAKTAAPPRG